jgi:DNA phosphorothioation-dependent restriction protein DptG
MKRLKNKIKSWCRYWHFNALGLLRDNGGHQNYLNVVSVLDDWFKTDTWAENKTTLEDNWKVVLNNLNKCSKEQLHKLDWYCHARKD